MMDIVSAVSRAIGKDIESLRGPSRRKWLSRARFAVYYFCRTESEVGKTSLPAIGKFMRRDHSTILHGLRRHETLLASSREYRAWWKDLEERYRIELIKVTASRHDRQDAWRAVDAGVKGLDAPCTSSLHIGDEPETAILCSPYSSKPPLS